MFRACFLNVFFCKGSIRDLQGFVGVFRVLGFGSIGL